MKFSIKNFNGIENLLFESNFNSNFWMKFFWKKINKTPLHIAVERGNKAIIQLLLNQEEIDINACDEIQSFVNLIKFYLIFYGF